MKSAVLSLTAAASFLCMSSMTTIADDTFESILETQTRTTFEKIAEYAKSNPDASDAESAWRWLFATAIQHGFEDDSVDLAKSYLDRPKQDPTTGTLAKQVQIFGLAKSGQSEAAVEQFQAQLQFARLRSGGNLVEFGLELATQLRMARDFEAARAVYSAVSEKFFLNPQVRERCDNKAAKLDLIDKPAPALGVADSAGNDVTLSDLEGKVVLLDFWATNCPPCIAELPNIKQLYAQLHDKGFEIVGISLDGDDQLVEQFSKQAGMTWRQIVDRQSVETLRERYHVRTIPSLYILDKKGTISQVDVKGRDLRRTVTELLEKE